MFIVEIAISIMSLKELLRPAKSAIGIVGMMIATSFGWGLIVAIVIQPSHGKMYLAINGIMIWRRIILYRVYTELSIAFSVMGNKNSSETKLVVTAVIRMNMIPLKIQTMRQPDFHSNVSYVI
jgi:hypothetical protein